MQGALMREFKFAVKRDKRFFFDNDDNQLIFKCLF